MQETSRTADPGIPNHELVYRSLRARVIADYIAGMTDRFALEEHRILTDPHARA